MSKTLYNEQPLINLLNMNAGDKHTVNQQGSRYVMGSKVSHREMDHITVAKLLEGTEKRVMKFFIIMYFQILLRAMLLIVQTKITTNY